MELLFIFWTVIGLLFTVCSAHIPKNKKQLAIWIFVGGPAVWLVVIYNMIKISLRWRKNGTTRSG